ncbi:2-deoxy-5-keto-D-gluconate 6-phosphate aldolase domain-containing protein, partial [Enterobacter asburiae]
VPRPDIDARLNHLHRVTSRRQQWPELCIFAFDHRKQLADLAHETGCDPASIPRLKLLLLAAAEAAAKEAGLEQRSGILADGTYGQSSLNAITGKG